MATIQKTTLKRFNSSDWDPVYLANSADITYLGVGFTIQETDGYKDAESIASTTPVSEILTNVVNHLAKISKTEIPALADGSSITSLDVNVLDGVIARKNLPTDVSGKGIEVATEEEKNALTGANVNVGDLVKVTNGKIYLVNAIADNGAVTYLELTDSASIIAWERINHPTTVDGYGISDAVKTSQLTDTAGAGKADQILTLNAEGGLTVNITGSASLFDGQNSDYYAKQSDMTQARTDIDQNSSDIDDIVNNKLENIDAGQIKTGVISIDRLPHGALERMEIVADDAALAALTVASVQNGDTVKVVSTGKMYYVIDDSKLGAAGEEWKDAFSEYTAGTASSVNWSGVSGTPTTLEGYGIENALGTTNRYTTANGTDALAVVGWTTGTESGVAFNIDGIARSAVLATEATHAADADTLGTHAVEYFATAQSVTDLAGTVNDNTEAIGKNAEDIVIANSAIASLQRGDSITSIDASKIAGQLTRTQLPSDISGRIHTFATLAEAQATLSSTTASYGDLIKVSTGNKIYAITSVADLANDNGYTLLVDIDGHTVLWGNISGMPDTLAGMPWTDKVTTALLTTTGGTGKAGQIVTLNADGTLHTDITGSASLFNGQNAEYYATKGALDNTNIAVGANTASIGTLNSQIKAIDASWITTGVISLDRLPHGALERCVVVADDTARFALRSTGGASADDDVQKGDTVKVVATGKMYFVVDDTKLDTEDGYEVYTAGTASEVQWSGVRGTPTTLAGYGITDAVNANEKVTSATPTNVGKILVLNADGQLDVDITGSVEWANILDKPTSTVEAIDAAVATATHANRTILDSLNVDVDGHLTYGGDALAFKSELDQVALGLQVTNALPDTATVGQMMLETIV